MRPAPAFGLRNAARGAPPLSDALLFPRRERLPHRANRAALAAPGPTVADLPAYGGRHSVVVARPARCRPPGACVAWFCPIAGHCAPSPRDRLQGGDSGLYRACRPLRPRSVPRPTWQAGAAVATPWAECRSGSAACEPRCCWNISALNATSVAEPDVKRRLFHVRRLGPGHRPGLRPARNKVTGRASLLTTQPFPGTRA